MIETRIKCLQNNSTFYESRQEKHHLADEVLDSTVVQVIQSMYDISKDEDLISCNGEDSLKNTFFGKHVTETDYKQRIENFWT